MATTHSWTAEGLGTPLRAENLLEPSKFDRFRMMFNRADMLERSNATCDSLNQQAGEMVIFPEVFTADHPVIGRYTVEEESAQFTMELAIFAEGPGVVFSTNRRRAWVSRIQRYCGLHPTEKNCVVLKIIIDPALVTETQIRQWFTYLLSGLHHSFKPQPVQPILTENWMGAPSPSWQASKH